MNIDFDLLKYGLTGEYDEIMLERENEELKQRIDKAIEYNKENKIFANEVENAYAEEICKNNLTILGDKENE